MGTLRLFSSTLSAQTVPGDDHKALVCLFLFGGNDGNNTLVPYDTPAYNAYASALPFPPAATDASGRFTLRSPRFPPCSRPENSPSSAT
jgi:uncharacterized protein (DUF1501 family)